MSAPALERPTDPTIFATLPAELVAALAAQGITAPTPVQAAVIPDGLAGHDVLGRAQTGSGKTLAFGIPVLARLAGEKSRPGHPARSWSCRPASSPSQLSRAITPLAASLKLRLATVYGGTPYDRQVRALEEPRRHRRGHPRPPRGPDQAGPLLGRRHRGHRPRRGRPPVRPRLLPRDRQARGHDAGRQPADAALRHARRRRGPPGAQAPALPEAAPARPERRAPSPR